MANNERSVYFSNSSAFYSSDSHVPDRNGDNINFYPMYGSSPPYPQNTHRASYPDCSSRALPSEIDLSAYDVPSSQINSIPIKNLLKSVHDQGWTPTSQGRHVQQVRPHAPAPAGWYGGGPLKTGAMSDPTPHQDTFGDMSSENGTSDAGDSGYSSNIPNVNAESASLNHSSINNTTPKCDLYRPPWMSTITGAANHPHLPPQSVKSDSRLQVPPRDTRKGRSGKVPLHRCVVCGRQPKNQSDAKKHNLNHTKPFKCKESGCSRKEGFATDNDLQRHRKTVHRANPTVGSHTGFVCAACSHPEGGKQPKFWPRRDNFKAHVKRKHPDWDIGELIDRSTRTTRPDDAKTAASVGHSSYPDSIANSNGHRRSILSNDLSTIDSSRRASQPDDQHNPWPPSSTGDFPRTEASLLGGMGHATMTDHAMLGPMELQALTDSTEVNGLSILSDAPFTDGITNFIAVTPPLDSQQAKRPRLGESSYYRGSEQNLQLASIESGSDIGMGSSDLQDTSNSNGSRGSHSCLKCGKNIQRECDYKKHMKRHTRPYGCTFTDCYKRFGSRNDWKRHESSQHYLEEIWKCRRENQDGTVCAYKPFERLEQIKSHLRSVHGLADELEITQDCASFRLGPNANDHFWCGFCGGGKLIAQDKSTPYAYAARFQHIGDHFDKEHADIDKWVCIENEQPKGKMTQDTLWGSKGPKEGTKRPNAGQKLPMPGVIPPGFQHPVKTYTKLPPQDFSLTER